MSSIGGEINAMQSLRAPATAISFAAIVLAPFASGAANSKLTSTVSESDNKSNPETILAAEPPPPEAPSLSSTPPPSESSIAEVDIVKLPPTALAAEPASDNDVEWSAQNIHSELELITSL